MNSPRARILLVSLVVVLALAGALLLAATRRRPVVSPPQPITNTVPDGAGTQPAPTTPAPRLPTPQPPPPGWEDRVKVLQDRIANNPKDQSAYAELGAMYITVQRIEDALPPLLRAVDLNPKDATSWFNLAGCYQQMLAFDLYTDALEHCIAARPDWIEPYRTLADVYERIGLAGTTRAIPLLREAHRRAPEDLPTLVALSSSLLRTGEDKTRNEGKRLVDEAYRLAPHEPVILSLMAYRAFLEDDFAAAEKYALEGLTLAPDSVELHMMMADIIKTGEQHDQREAIPHLQVIIQLQPTRHDAYLMLAQVFRRLNDDEKARTVLERLLTIVPSASEEVYRMLAEIYQAKGDAAKAKTFHDQAESRRVVGERLRTLQATTLANPKDVPAATALANEYFKQGGDLAGIMVLKEAAKASPSDPRPFLELEKYYRAHGRTRLADDAHAAARRRGAP